MVSVFELFMKRFPQHTLAGDAPLMHVASNVWLAKLQNGETVTLRSVSGSASVTGARWTIDLRGNKELDQLAQKKKQFELKFR